MRIFNNILEASQRVRIIKILADGQRNYQSRRKHLPRQVKIVRRFFLIVFLTNNLYLFWLAFNIAWNWLGLLIWVMEFLVWLHVLFYFFNQYDQKHESAALPRLTKPVDLFVPAVNEPLEMVKNTLESAKEILHDNKKIFLLDDSGNFRYHPLADSLGVNYLARNKRIHAKAGNLNYGLKNSNGEFILVLDADQVAQRNILEECLGHFQDSRVALVTTKQSFAVSQNDFNHDHLFYGSMQPGKNKHGCAISCGSGVIYRRRALEQIDGFAEWNLVEDLTTTLELNAAGFKSVYVNQVYSKGTAPVTLSGIYKQRGTWAYDTLRMFFRRNPLFIKGIKFRQACYYLEMSYAYLMSGIVLPALYLIPIISLMLNEPIVRFESAPEYIALKLPAFIAVLAMYYFLCQGFKNAQYWASLFPVYLKAFALAILPKKIKYIVTIKTNESSKAEVRLILPQLLVMLAYLFSVVWHYLQYGFNFLFMGGLFWMSITSYWMLPIIIRGLNLNYYLSRTGHLVYRILKSLKIHSLIRQQGFNKN